MAAFSIATDLVQEARDKLDDLSTGSAHIDEVEDSAKEAQRILDNVLNALDELEGDVEDEYLEVESERDEFENQLSELGDQVDALESQLEAKNEA